MVNLSTHGPPLASCLSEGGKVTKVSKSRRMAQISAINTGQQLYSCKRFYKMAFLTVSTFVHSIGYGCCITVNSWERWIL